MSSDLEKESSNCGYGGCGISSIGRCLSMKRREGLCAVSKLVRGLRLLVLAPGHR
jgi:hypothetical protein